MVDLDDLVYSCRDALAEVEPRTAVKSVVERAVSQPGRLLEALPPTPVACTCSTAATI
jgi:hypothetical protein